MGKLKHYTSEGYWYFVTTTCADFTPHFKKSANAKIAANVLKNLGSRNAGNVLSRVIMPEHIHLIMIPKKYSLKKFMQEYKKSVSRLINILEMKTGRKMWMEGYYEEIIRSEKDLTIKIQYIEYNPVKRWLVSEPEDYEWSSANRRWSR